MLPVQLLCESVHCDRCVSLCYSKLIMHAISYIYNYLLVSLQLDVDITVT